MITKRKRLDRPSFRSLLATRHGALLLAMICALIAVGILLFAMNQYRHTVTAHQPQQATVLVSTAEIQRGTSATVLASRSLYKVVPVLASQVSPDAITNAGALVGKVTANTILPGEQLTAADFTIPTGAGSQLASTERAVALTLDAAHGLGNAIHVGDHVDVYGSFSAQGGGSDNVIHLVAPDAVVLEAIPGTGTANYVLLGLSDQLAPKLLWVADYGKVWLVLRPSLAADPAPTVTGVYQVLANHYNAPASTGGHP